MKGRRIVPNLFTISLSPRDHAGFAEIDDALNAELCETAREYARSEGYHFMGNVTVEMVVDNEMKPGRFTVKSHMKESGGGGGVGSLVLPSGERIGLGSRVHHHRPPARLHHSARRHQRHRVVTARSARRARATSWPTSAAPTARR